MAKTARDERVISQFDNRENSIVAMRTLLRFAQTKVESGIGGGFPLDQVATAKEYFLMWKRKKPFENNSMVFGFASFAILIFFFTSNIEMLLAIVGVIGAWTIFSILEVDKMRKKYIREMIGDMSNLSLKDRKFYLDGLRSDLWNVEEEKFKIKSFFITLFLTLVSFLSIAFFEDMQIKYIGFIFATGSIIAFFGGGAVETIFTRRK